MSGHPALTAPPGDATIASPFAVRVPPRRSGPHRPTLDYYEEALDAQNIAELARAIEASQKLLKQQLRNVLVLAGQAEARQMSITQLAGFKTWLKHGRAVRKGETGLRVFAPHSRRRDGDDDRERHEMPGESA